MYKYLLILASLLMTSSNRHPFYTSVTEVEYSSKTRELGMACKTFPDDMEEALRIHTGKKYDLYKTDKQILNPVLEDYFKKHIAVMVNDKPRTYTFLGYEIDKEVIWCYFNSTKLTGVKSIGIRSDLMYEYKPEQTNIIHLDLDGKKQSFKLMAPVVSARLAAH